jgi:hypothetical protein
MSNRSRVLIVEAVVGDRVHDQPAAVRMDLHNLVLARGKERMSAEFASLLLAAGLRLVRVLAPASTPGIHVVEATAGTQEEDHAPVEKLASADFSSS